MSKYTEALRFIGRKGGKRRTKRKREAARRNIAIAQTQRLSRRLCRVCKKNRVSKNNKSHICRVCQRKHGLATAKRKAGKR